MGGFICANKGQEVSPPPADKALFSFHKRGPARVLALEILTSYHVNVTLSQKHLRYGPSFNIFFDRFRSLSPTRLIDLA